MTLKENQKVKRIIKKYIIIKHKSIARQIEKSRLCFYHNAMSTFQLLLFVNMCLFCLFDTFLWVVLLSTTCIHFFLSLLSENEKQSCYACSSRAKFTTRKESIDTKMKKKVTRAMNFFATYVVVIAFYINIGMNYCLVMGILKCYCFYFLIDSQILFKLKRLFIKNSPTSNTVQLRNSHKGNKTFLVIEQGKQTLYYSLRFKCSSVLLQHYQRQVTRCYTCDFEVVK